MTAPDLARLLAPDYGADTGSLSLDELRARRAECQEVEVGLSYVRRLTQGRLDIILAELERRASGGEVGELSDLVERLPEILAEHVHAPGLGRLPTFLAPGESGATMTGELDRIVSPSCLSTLPQLGEHEVRAVGEALRSYERKISDQRRALHERIDAFQDEIVRRYKTGQADVSRLWQ